MDILAVIRLNKENTEVKAYRFYYAITTNGEKQACSGYSRETPFKKIVSDNKIIYLTIYDEDQLSVEQHLIYILRFELSKF